MPIYAHTILMLCDAGLLFLCTTVMNDTAACHSPQVKRARSLGHTKSAYYRYKSLLARSGKHKRLLTHHFLPTLQLISVAASGAPGHASYAALAANRGRCCTSVYAYTQVPMHHAKTPSSSRYHVVYIQTVTARA